MSFIINNGDQDPAILINGFGEGYGDTGDHFAVKDDGTVIYTTVQEGYKEGIEWLHKLVTEDLVDPEAFTQEWSTYVAKGKNHRYGLCFTWDIANIDNNTDYVMLPALTGPEGVRNITRQNNSETSGFDRGRCVLTSSCRNTALAAAWIDQTEILKQVKIGLEKLRDMVEVGSGVITSSETEDLDWINNWKKYFTSFTIDDILIKPTWEELKEEDKDKFLIEIDPGISFGTGKHETTQLCIRQLQKYVEGKHPKVLDVGCGSGILSIVALKLGAREVVGTDLDADCMTSTRDNMQVNHLDLSLGTFYVGNLIDDEELQEKVGTEEYEIVVANILAPVIIAMAPVIPARLKQGGYFITSGIIDFKENEVKEAIEAAGLTVVEINHQGEWVNITAQKQ